MLRDEDRCQKCQAQRDKKLVYAVQMIDRVSQGKQHNRMEWGQEEGKDNGTGRKREEETVGKARSSVACSHVGKALLLGNVRQDRPVWPAAQWEQELWAESGMLPPLNM